MEESQSVENLIDFAVQSIQRAQADDSPFYHLRFDRVFPDDFYAAMLEAMPVTDDYRALSGKAKLRNRTPDGQPTRAKIDLFPEYVRHLPQKKRAVWDVAGRILRSKELEKVFVERLAPGLKRRFGANFTKVRMYPVPILTRDVAGYYITAHSDTLWKGITVQFYLPADNSTPHIGTIFHEMLPNASKPKRAQMLFSPNTGYAFAVGDNTWHSVGLVGPEVKTRDSILLTYFVDAGPSRFLRNRGRRLQNFVLNEMRNLGVA
jgi:hypothetical protein